MSGSGRRVTVRLLQPSEAAKILGVHPSTLRRWTDTGQIRAVQAGGRGPRRYLASEVARIAEERSPYPWEVEGGGGAERG